MMFAAIKIQVKALKVRLKEVKLICYNVYDVRMRSRLVIRLEEGNEDNPEDWDHNKKRG